MHLVAFVLDARSRHIGRRPGVCNGRTTLTLEICHSYEKAETDTQAEVNSVVSGAIDALNITQTAPTAR